MRVALLATNMLRINKGTRKGTEIFVYIYAKHLARAIAAKHESINMTAFASGNSDFPFPIQSINYVASNEDKDIGVEHHKIFEIALFAKAFAQHQKFDLYHVHVSNGEWLMPFARLVKKPILVTMHGSTFEIFNQRFFALYKDVPNVHFVSISDSQRNMLPRLNYIKTIYHGIDVNHHFTFDPHGGPAMMWAGRGIPEKGLDVAMKVVQRTGRKAQFYPIIVDHYLPWLKREVLNKQRLLRRATDLTLEFNLTRSELVSRYHKAKVFLFPLAWEEPFGLVMAEALATGTPVVAFARGSTTEIIDDGITGFLINPSPSDHRGNFQITKTGIDGLCEAVERIYNLPQDKYEAMRLASRKSAEKYFSIHRMIDEYISLYKQIHKMHQK